MTHRERIIDYLKTHPEGADDDQIAFDLGLKSRQQSNSRCRQLEAEGFVKRKAVNNKIRNFWVETYGNPPLAASIQSIQKQKHKAIISENRYENWFWEGNVQSQVINYLVSQQYKILSVADTASHQQGVVSSSK
ncbi:MAG: hypothetical protein CVU39_22690 [Chloroflexi bacterium HGW-Chloroflexi-10]|nr:MAG: hypothetical protein CVU39_22690 [Chloroflexi bacterium HGW-Chloroflexi-10]